MAALAVLMGLPGSGKTIFSAQFAEKAKSEGYKVLTVRLDDLVSRERQAEIAVEAASDLKVWRETRLKVVEAAKAFLKGEERDCEVFKQLAANNPDVHRPKLVLVDDVNELRSMRREWQRVARDLGLGFCQFHLHLDVEKAVDRASKRAEGERVPESSVRAIAQRLEPPEPLKNRWERYSFRIDGLADFANFLDVCFEAVKASASDPETPIEDKTEEIEA